MAEEDLKQFVLMPPREAPSLQRPSSPASKLFLEALSNIPLGALVPLAASSLGGGASAWLGAAVGLAGVAARAMRNMPPRALPRMRVIDSVRKDGPKLVEMSSQSASGLRALQPGVRLVPVLYYTMALAPRPLIGSGPKPASSSQTIRFEITVVSKKTGDPIAGAMVMAYTDYAHRQGVQGKTNSKGKVLLTVNSSEGKLKRVYIYPPKQGYWGLLKRNVPLTASPQFELQPVDLSFRDGLRTLYPNTSDEAGAGVTVAVIDSGVAQHPDLKIEGGSNAVPGEDPKDYGDNGTDGHGTHVAGIIGARATPPHGIRGLAPAAALRSYRVYPKSTRTATNYAIAKAIDHAVDDHCDLINLSIDGGAVDEVLVDSISRAVANGSLVIAAAGNESDTGKRKEVCFPANDSQVIAVSAMGRRGTWPSMSVEDGDVAVPQSSLSKTKRHSEFIARFSNIGKEIDFTAPGVGILSTVPGGYAPLSGTSMACPAVTGAAASVLSRHPELLKLARDGSRSEAMAQAVFLQAQSRGFEAKYEGHGMLVLP